MDYPQILFQHQYATHFRYPKTGALRRKYEILAGAQSNMGKVEEQIISVLENSRKPLTLVEIADQIGKSPKTVFKSLRKLFEEGKVDCDIKNHQYTLKKE